MRYVILFGLSANPPTGLGGHAGLVRWAATEAQVSEWGDSRADEVWVLPVFQHAYRAKRDLAPFEHRMAMARIAFEHLPDAKSRVWVSDIEREVHERMAASAPEEQPGTIDVVLALQAKYPQTSFALLLGADTYQDLLDGRWKQSEALRRRIPVLAAPRKGVEAAGLQAPDGPRLDEISSSQVRANYARWANGLQPEVRAYIERHHLYGT